MAMKRNKFSLSHNKLLTCKGGYLVPMTLMEVLPSDVFQHDTSALIRTLPMVRPTMHPLHIKVHQWYCPIRLVWDDYEKFMTGGKTGEERPVAPYIMSGVSGFAVGSLADYLGLPTGIPNMKVSALPFRIYAKIWNEFYRDQDLQDEIVISTASGEDTTTNVILQRGAWEKDYFTTSRPWAQRGDDVMLPLGGNAPIIMKAAPNTQIARLGSTSALATTGNVNLLVSSDSARYMATAGAVTTPTVLDLNGSHVADLSAATGINVNDLRFGLAMQRFKENSARFGNRLYDYFMRSFGVKASDARLQRPEYLAGGKQTIQMSEVLQTAPSEEAPVGNLTGHGIGAIRSNRYRRYFEEHGYVLTLLQIMPKTMYTQGVPRHWTRNVKEDYFQPEFQHIGQQEVLNKEIYAAHASPDGVWGFQDRYDDYRRMESSVAGLMRTTESDWHMARIFGSAPALNGAFVSSMPTDRIFAVNGPEVHEYYVMARHNVNALRPVAKTGSSFTY